MAGIDLTLFVHELLSDISSKINDGLRNFKPDLSKGTGVVPPKSLPLSNSEALGTTARPGFAQPATPGEETAGKVVAADDPRVTLADAVGFTAGEMNTAAGYTSGDEMGNSPAVWSLDRKRVFIEGMVTKASDMATNDVILTAPALIHPTQPAYGDLKKGDGAAYAVRLDPNGQLVYLGPTLTNDTGAAIFVTYRVA